MQLQHITSGKYGSPIYLSDLLETSVTYIPEEAPSSRYLGALSMCLLVPPLGCIVCLDFVLLQKTVAILKHNLNL